MRFLWPWWYMEQILMLCQQRLSLRAPLTPPQNCVDSFLWSFSAYFIKSPFSSDLLKDECFFFCLVSVSHSCVVERNSCRTGFRSVILVTRVTGDEFCCLFSLRGHEAVLRNQCLGFSEVQKLLLQHVKVYSTYRLDKERQHFNWDPSGTEWMDWKRLFRLIDGGAGPGGKLYIFGESALNTSTLRDVEKVVTAAVSIFPVLFCQTNCQHRRLFCTSKSSLKSLKKQNLHVSAFHHLFLPIALSICVQLQCWFVVCYIDWSF